MKRANKKARKPLLTHQGEFWDAYIFIVEVVLLILYFKKLLTTLESLHGDIGITRFRRIVVDQEIAFTRDTTHIIFLYVVSNR